MNIEQNSAFNELTAAQLYEHYYDKFCRRLDSQFPEIRAAGVAHDLFTDCIMRPGVLQGATAADNPEAFVWTCLKRDAVRWCERRRNLHLIEDEILCLIERAYDTGVAASEKRQRQQIRMSEMLRGFVSHCEEKTGKGEFKLARLRRMLSLIHISEPTRPY